VPIKQKTHLFVILLHSLSINFTEIWQCQWRTIIHVIFYIIYQQSTLELALC